MLKFGSQSRKMKIILTDEAYKASNGCSTCPTPITEIVSGKNTKAAFQVAIISGERCQLNTGKSTALLQEITLPRFRVEVETQFHYNAFPIGYLADENGIMRADILHSSPIVYSGDTLACAYIELEIPTDARHGDYPIKVSVFKAVGARDETLIESSTLKLTVLNYALPDPAVYSIYLDLWQHTSNVARAYEVEPFSDSHFDKLSHVAKALGELGQKSITALIGDCPWRGWGCYILRENANLYEYSHISIFEKEGSFIYDFSALDRYINLCFKHGIDGDITLYGITGIWTNMPLFPCDSEIEWPEPVLIRYKTESGAYAYMKKNKDIRDYISAVLAHFKQLGLLEKVRFGADEPRNENAFNQSYELIKSIDPNVKFKMALDSSSAISKFAESIDDIAASFPCVCRDGEQLKALKADRPDMRLLWYVCNIPDRPNTFLSSDLTECLSLGYLMYAFEFDGFLRWAFTCWTDNPTMDIRFHNDALPAGDVALIYPAASGGVLLSLRYKALKRAIEDFELLKILESFDKATASELVFRIVKDKDFKNFMLDDKHSKQGILEKDNCNFKKLRKEILNKLIEFKEKKTC